LNARFGFRDAEAIVPYLDLLGVSHLYCSPCLRAREGSSHGYDIVDHDALNPELGTREEFESLVRALKSRGMGILLDIVPNHMGVLAADNARWLDVLENGPASRSARFFDIDWEPPAAHLAGRVLLPVLGATYGTALESGDMKLAFDAERGAFAVQYFEHRLPIDPRCYPEILERAGLSDLAGDFASLPARDAPEESALDERAERVPLLQARLRDAARDAAVTARLQEAIETYHGTPGVAASFDALHALLERQAYRPAYWGVAQDELNYRRFFDVNDLAALRQEDALVFDETHRFVASLVRDGSVDGLRIDHPDGLFDPKGYFERLQDACGKPTYVVVEKILATHEGLRETWAVHGTTGYDFANLVNGLFVDPRAEARITRAYALFTGDGGTFEESARLARRQVLAGALGAELRVLANRLARIALADRRYRDFTLETLRTALAEVLAAFPIYRTYIDDEAREQDLVAIERALAVARSARKASDPGVFDFIQDALSAQLPAGTPAAAAAIRQFSRKFQQLSAPVMAKGVEDTAFYRFNRLVSLNDVGGDPARFGTTPSAFHRDALDRARAWPHSLLATSTHDNKRSEDVRARIDAISEMAGAWRLALRRWHDWNAAKRTRLGDAWAPSLDDEYLLYQTLLGSFPQEQGADLDAYAERIVTYMRKAQREAKRHTSWTRVDEAYEAATEGFVRAILANGPANRFLDDLRAALAQVAWLGALNSLSLLTLKLTAPGVPDIYQGNELFDFSLVDPDNRRPVDFARRAQLLDTFRDEVDAAAIFREMGDRAKLLVCARLLGLRRTREALFREGRYVPLRVSGARARHVVAFMRRSGRDALVVVAPRLFGGLGVAPGVLPCGEAVWGDTAIEAPPLEASVADLFTSRVHAPAAHYRLAELLAVSPVAVLATIPGV
jgi:(1->4)-alpha-D-glucan 1-alpha-D-glucosylmutase